MNSVLVVGNIHKDIYLQLDDAQCEIELDAKNTPWLDLGFDGRGYNFVERESVLSGAAITLEVLQNLRTKAQLLEHNDRQSPVCDHYRYILSVNSGVLYLTPGKCRQTKWKAPTEAIDWILVDQSAKIEHELVAGIKAYLSVSRETKLAVFVDAKNQKKPIKSKENAAVWELLSLADLIFTNSELKTANKQAKICKIKNQEIVLGKCRQSFGRKSMDLLTDETLSMVIVATVFASLANGASEKLALILAKINAEGCQMGRSLSLSQLKDHLSKWQKRQKDLVFLARSIDEKILNSEKVITMGDRAGDQTAEVLNKNLGDYYENGVRYLKWQCDFRLEKIKTATSKKDLLPSPVEIEGKLNKLSSLITKSQEYGLVPILEFKLNLVSTVSAKSYHELMIKVLDTAFERLESAEVKMDAVVLGLKLELEGGEEEALRVLETDLAKETAEVLEHHVPGEVAGVFTSITTVKSE